MNNNSNINTPKHYTDIAVTHATAAARAAQCGADGDARYIGGCAKANITKAITAAGRFAVVEAGDVFVAIKSV